MRNCVAEIVSAFEGVTEAEANAIVARMSKARREAFADGMTNPDSGYRKKAMDIVNNYRGLVLQEKLRAMENVTKYRRANNMIAAFKGEGTDSVEGFLALTVGSGKRIEDSGGSVDAIQRNMGDLIASNLQSSLIPEHLEIARGGQLDLEIRQAWKQLNTKGGSTEGMNPVAIELAKALQKNENFVYSLQNGSGAYKRRLEGFSGSITHDATKLGLATKEKWINDILPLLDAERTFNSGLIEENPKEFLGRIFDDIQTGRSGSEFKVDAGEDSVSSLVAMPASFSKRIERGRTLHFTDAAAEQTYSSAYGNGKTLFEQVLSSNQRAAKDIGLMRVFGTNPEATMLRLAREHEIDLNGLGNKAKNAMDEVMGVTSRVGESWKATIGQNARAWQSLTMLGSAGLSSLPDFAVKQAYAQGNGMPFFEAAGKGLTEFFSNIRPSERRKVAEEMGVGADAMIRHLTSGMRSPDSNGGGLMSKAMALEFKLNGLTIFTDAQIASNAQMNAYNIGKNAHLPMGELPARLQSNLKRYGMNDSDWNFIRSIASEADDKNKYVGWRDLFQADNAKVEAHLRETGAIKPDAKAVSVRRIVEQYKVDTGTKYSTYINDQSKSAQVEPGARERATLLQGTHADTAAGQLMRMIAQFKMFPTAMVQRVVPEVAFSNGAQSWGQTVSGSTNSIAPLASMVTTLTGLGYMSLALKNVIKGKAPPDPSKGHTWKEAMLQGGAGGVYADILLKDFDSREGNNIIASLAGPVAGTTADAFSLKAKLMDDDATTKAKQGAALRFGKKNIPFGNVPYIKAALDKYIFYDLQERINPGFQSRMEARARKKGEVPLSEMFNKEAQE